MRYFTKNLQHIFLSKYCQYLLQVSWGIVLFCIFKVEDRIWNLSGISQ